MQQRIERTRQTESVWDYPRPPLLEPVVDTLRVVHAGVTIAETDAGYRVLETSHPPVYYFPAESIVGGVLERASGISYCEFKGNALYWDLVVGEQRAAQAAWSYPDPSTAFNAIADYFAFYASRVDECWVNDEQVIPQPGDFYGGWITTGIAGPFKGGPGTRGW